MSGDTWCELLNMNEEVWRRQATAKSEVLTWNEMMMWKQYFSSFIHLWEVSKGIFVEQDGTIMCRAGKMPIGHSKELGGCQARCVPCTPRCGGNNSKCNRPGHMWMTQVRLWITSNFGLCNLCLAYFQYADVPSTTHEVSRKWKEWVRVDQHARRQVRFIENVCQQPPSCSLEGITQIWQKGVDGQLSVVGLGDYSPYMRLISGLQITVPNDTGNIVRSRLNHFMYIGMRMLEYQSTFLGFVLSMDLIFVESQTMMMEKQKKKGGSGQPFCGIQVLRELDRMQMTTCLESRCFAVANLSREEVLENVGRGQRTGIGQKECRGCQFKMGKAYEMLSGMVYAEDLWQWIQDYNRTQNLSRPWQGEHPQQRRGGGQHAGMRRESHGRRG
eukprot:CAMPEP_0181296364 /NCGR_PEP_ID=MMETSP1101-20121128/4663_1 /TAXON_ID=46948 /ORGANISM="Rhodomonas abbreviata, Strain Caron Lab Isolate" /LENGTH=385 /DNA_ID=CAMNT_0023401221 /DNA_START=1019 /DNA_END=2173 /DNA_ORIENTATION=+